MAAPSKPTFSVQPPSIVATDQAVQLAVFSSGATSLLVRVNTVSDLPEVVWTGTFEPISTVGLFSASVPIPSMSLESGGNYEFAVFGNNSDGTSDGTFASFVAVDRAIVTLTPADGATINDLPLTVSWGVTDETGVSFQGLYVRDASTDAVLYYGTPSVFERSVTLGMADLAGIEDGKSYEIDLRVGNGYGVITRVVHTITTSWAAPVIPTATVTTDHSALTASVTVTAGPYVPYDQPATDTIMVVRVSPDGTRHVLADDLESGDTVTDPLPPLGVEYSYEVTGIAATGVPSAPATVTHTNATACWAFNFGADASALLVLYGNPKESYGLEHGGRAYHFADGGAGRGLPVWYGTTDRDISGTTSFDTVLWHESDRLQQLCDSHAVGWMRDPHGNRRRVHMEPKVSHGVGEVWQVSISWDEMRWEEPANG